MKEAHEEEIENMLQNFAPAESPEKNNDCPICMEEYDSKENIKCTSKGCGHQMCFSCFEEILGNKNPSARKCPFCNKKVQPNQILKLY
ncbi:Oidioi.mRNA.OKI2018_I69.chr2.g6374.t1.cds [Oikopleura dioica]|uniref:Oidioi.mRNA.OKI2018_I69.chr2.g6374.t1.cds n=1 Tax=Oikopleura dioica TaxID=34765 RepID=A0ABN7T526_OIKDI|nr:Oidioi.mRNA.OKI2018_I69.chr2.g6374.t1.cds [Oikopleura dioica]